MLQRSSEMDLRILDWAIDAVGEDDTVEKLFEAIPRFFRSDLVNRDLPAALSTKFWEALNGFLGRTLLSNSVFESVKIRRVITCMNATNALHGPFSVSKILYDIFEGRWGQALQSVETGYALAPWCAKDNIIDISGPARCIVASILARARKRTDRWVALAADQFGIPDYVLRDHIDHGDSVLLFILVNLTRKVHEARKARKIREALETLEANEANEARKARKAHEAHEARKALEAHEAYEARKAREAQDEYWRTKILSTISQFSIPETLPRLQNEFCALWNELVLEARDNGPYSMPLDILHKIRLAYIDLHRSTDALPTAFSTSTGDLAQILYQPSSYPLCDIAGHRPDSNDAFRTPIERQPLPTTSLDVAIIPVPQGTTNKSTSSLTARPIPPPTSSAGNPPQTSRQLAIGPSVVSDPIQPPVLMPTLGSGIYVDSPSTVEYPRIWSDATIPHALGAPGSPSSSRSYRHHAPQFPSVSERHVVLNVETADGQHDVADVGSKTPMEVVHHRHPSASADVGTSEKTSLPEDHQHDHN